MMSVDTAVKGPFTWLALPALLALVVMGWATVYVQSAEAQTPSFTGPSTGYVGEASTYTCTHTGYVIIRVYTGDGRFTELANSGGDNGSGPRTYSYTWPKAETYTVQCNNNRGGRLGSINVTVTIRPTPAPTPTPTPTPAPLEAYNVRLISTISYTLDVEEMNRLELQAARGDWAPVRSVEFRCATSDGVSVVVSNNPVDNALAGISAWKMPQGTETALQATVLGIRSEIIRNMTCRVRLWNAATATDDPDFESNAVQLRWQQKGRTLIRKEQAFRGTPGGTATWLFLPPVFLGLVFAGVTKNAAGTLLVVAATLGVAVWFTDSPPVLWVVVVGTAAAGVLLFIQFGFRGR